VFFVLGHQVSAEVMWLRQRVAAVNQGLVDFLSLSADSIFKGSRHTSLPVLLPTVSGLLS
jgi:hypothetical protein